MKGFIFFYISVAVMLTIADPGTGRTVSGVLDRVEDNGQAVILIGELEKELVMPNKKLPPGSHENSWFQIKMLQGKFEVTSVDAEKTRREKEKSKILLDRLQHSAE